MTSYTKAIIQEIFKTSTQLEIGNNSVTKPWTAFINNNLNVPEHSLTRLYYTTLHYS